MKELKMQRITFEEIQEFFELNLEDRKFNPDDPTDPNNVLMLIYNTDSDEFEAVAVGDGKVPIMEAKLTADILSNQDWVVEKEYKSGMTFQKVMEQLLKPLIPATASLAVAPRVYNAWEDKTLTGTISFSKGSAGKILGIVATYNGNDVTFVVDASGDSATATFQTGEVALGDTKHTLVIPLNATMTHEKAPGSVITSSIDVSFNTVVSSPLIYGISAGKDETALTSMVDGAIDGIFKSEEHEKSFREKRAQESSSKEFKPVPLKMAYHWVASTRKFTSWQDLSLSFNKGEIVDTHDVYTITTHGVTYYIHVTKAVTTYDNITLKFK